MKKILIYQDIEQIENKTSELNRILPTVQEIHNLIKSMGIEVTLGKIEALKYFSRAHDHKHHYYKNWFLDELYNKADNPNINGIPISKEKFAVLIDIPDYEPLDKALYKVSDHFDMKLFTLNNGVIGLISNLKDVLMDRFSYYTESQKQNDLVDNLNPLIVALNSFIGFHNQDDILHESFKYILKKDGVYILNHITIRQF